MKLPVENIKKINARVETLIAQQGIRADALMTTKITLIYLQAQRDLLAEMRKDKE